MLKRWLAQEPRSAKRQNITEESEPGVLLPLIPEPKAILGTVKVAKYFPGKPAPITQGFRNVVIHTSGKGLGGGLSPYVLKDEHGALLENIWQFSKVYPEVTEQRTPLSRFHPDQIIWKHPAEVHVQDGQVLPAYWDWRKRGLANPFAVRYPNGFHGRRGCLFSLWPSEETPNSYERLSYIAARKKIYCSEYIRLAPRTEDFRKLQALLLAGTNLQIVEVDGPDPSLDFPPYNQISRQDPGLNICEATIKTLIEDDRKPFGHGYVIAALLLGGRDWMK